MKCEYPYSSSATGHSILIGDETLRWCWLQQLAGIGLDGRGLYGQFEGVSDQLPVLDACGGHTGPTPASSFTDKAGNVVQVAAQSNGYHYHIIAGGALALSQPAYHEPCA